jgi:hypothetical protein
VTDETRTRDPLSSHNPPTPVAQGCELLQKPLIDADFLALGCPVFPRAARGVRRRRFATGALIIFPFFLFRYLQGVLKCGGLRIRTGNTITFS